MIAPADPVGGAAAQQAARAELRSPEYRGGGPGPIDRVLHWLGRQVDALFAGGTGSNAVLVVLVVLLGIAILLAARAGLPARRATRASAAGDLLAPDAQTDHRAAALAFAAQGRRAEALREWLREVIDLLERRGLLAPRPGRTGASTAREVAGVLPAAAPVIGRAAAAFDEVWFGGRHATDDDVTAGRAAADAADQAVGRADVR